jgi:hypothetical protein
MSHFTQQCASLRDDSRAEESLLCATASLLEKGILAGVGYRNGLRHAPPPPAPAGGGSHGAR